MDHWQLLPERRSPKRQLTQEQPSPSCAPLAAPATCQPSTEKTPREELHTQDWVSEPPERKSSGRHWSVSIDERRRLAALRTLRDSARSLSPSRDITQLVAELVSEDVDRDVLLPNPPRSSESINAFQDFLTRSSPFWQKANVEPQNPRSPPS